MQQLIEKVTLQPIFDKDMIRGNVIYVDAFGNAITNISKDLFNKVQKGRHFVLYFKRNETITNLSWHYNEVGEGENFVYLVFPTTLKSPSIKVMQASYSDFMMTIPM
jgi:S-adenosylmethionine hydrolase